MSPIVHYKGWRRKWQKRLGWFVLLLSTLVSCPVKMTAPTIHSVLRRLQPCNAKNMEGRTDTSSHCLLPSKQHTASEAHQPADLQAKGSRHEGVHGERAVGMPQRHVSRPTNKLREAGVKRSMKKGCERNQGLAYSQEHLVGGDGDCLLANHQVARERVQRVVRLFTFHHCCSHSARQYQTCAKT